MPDERSRQAKTAMKRRRNVLLVLGIILLVFLGALLLWLALTGQDPFGGQDERSVVDSPVDGFLLDKLDADTLTPFADAYLLRLSPNRLSVLNLEGAEEFSFGIRSESPRVTTASDYALVYEQDGYDYYLVQPTGVIYEGRTLDPIVEAQVSNQGQAALILDAPDTRGVLRVMEKDGRHLFDYRLRDRMRSGYLITVNFAESQPYLDLSLLNTDGAIPRPLIHRFDLETAKLTDIYQMDATEVLPVIAQGIGGDMLAIGPTSVWRMEDQHMVPWQEVAKIEAAIPCQNGAAALASETYDGEIRLYYLKFGSDATQFSELPSISVGSHPENFVSRNNFVAVSDGSTIYLVNVNTMATDRIELGSQILKMSLDDRGRVLVVTQDRVIRL